MVATSVSRPESADQLHELMRQAVADETRLAVVGAGSKRSMGRPIDTQHEIDLSELSGVKLYEPEELVLTAVAGTPLAEIEQITAERDQQLAFEPPDFGPLLGEPPGKGTVAGAIACNLGGPRRIKSGAARDHFLGFQAINGRGEPFKSGGRVVKNVTGYDLPKLLAGSWGTLGVMTEVTLKILPAAEVTATVLVAGLDDATANKLMTSALQSPNDVSGAAHLPAVVSAKSGVLAIEESVTALRIEGPAPSVADRATALASMAGEYCRTDDVQILEPLDPAASLLFWAEVRDARFFVATDDPLWRLSVPPAEGPRIASAIVSALGTAKHYFDWGGGLIWIATQRSPDAGADIVRAALGINGGHATLVRAPQEIRARVSVFQPLEPVLEGLNRQVKASFDPLGILNPGRMYEGL